MTDRWLGWHFLSADRRLRWGSRSREVVEAGQTYRAEGPLALCANGMHASTRELDALIYAPGPVVCRVELLGERLDGGDKSCARERRVLWIADATAGLHAFACAVAMDALHLTEARGARVDPRSWVAIETKRRWLRGEATDAELHAAWSAARSAALSAALSAESAAQSAAQSAARSAAWSAESAARSAAQSAAWSAAQSAAQSAARSAAWSAALSAARSAESAAWSAALSAAWSAAWSAAQSAQNVVLETLLGGLAP